METSPLMSATAATRPPARRAPPLPWLDRAGRLSVLKLAVFVLVLAPGAYLAGALALDALGPKPVTAAIHETGDWAVRLLVASLAITPLRRIANWPQLILVRRMIGVAALGYLLVHFALYIVDQGFDLRRVATEIVLRVYLTIGFVALVGLSVLGATSTDAMVKRLGPLWHRLHRWVYLLMALGLVHYLMQTKLNVTQPVLWTGVFLLLMGHRALHAAGVATRPLTLAGLAVVAGIVTALFEGAWYKLATGARVPFLAILEQNLDVSYELRPALWVAIVGLGLAAVNLVRGKPARPARAQMTLASTSGRPAATRS